MRGRFTDLGVWPELLSIVVYGGPESGGFPSDLPFIDAIDELHFGDEVSELIEPPESSPALLGAHGELVHQAQGRLYAQAVPLTYPYDWCGHGNQVTRLFRFGGGSRPRKGREKDNTLCLIGLRHVRYRSSATTAPDSEPCRSTSIEWVKLGRDSGTSAGDQETGARARASSTESDGQADECAQSPSA